MQCQSSRFVSGSIACISNRSSCYLENFFASGGEGKRHLSMPSLNKLHYGTTAVNSFLRCLTLNGRKAVRMTFVFMRGSKYRGSGQRAESAGRFEIEESLGNYRFYSPLKRHYDRKSRSMAVSLSISRSSFFAIDSKCTSSGPSASLRVRAYIQNCASG